jgi:hypothetical protein
VGTLLKESFQKWPLDKTLSQLGFPSLKLNEELFVIVHHKCIGSLRNHGQNNFLVLLQTPMATTIQLNRIESILSKVNTTIAILKLALQKWWKFYTYYKNVLNEYVIGT